MDPLHTACVGYLKLPLFDWLNPAACVTDLRDDVLGDTMRLRDDNLACSWYGTFVVQTDDVDKLCDNLKGQATIVDDLGCTTSVDGKQLLNVVLSVNAPYKDKRWLVRPVQHQDKDNDRSRDEWRVFDQTLKKAAKLTFTVASDVSRALELRAEKLAALRAVRDQMGGRAGLFINPVSQAINSWDDMYLVVSLEPLETLLVPLCVREALKQQAETYADQLAHATAELQTAEQELATVWNSQGRAFLEAEIRASNPKSLRDNLEPVIEVLKEQRLVTDTKIDVVFPPTAQFDLAATAMRTMLQRANVDQVTSAIAVEKLRELERLLEGHM